MSFAGYALYLVVGVLFFELFRRLDVISDVRRVFDIAPAAVGVMRSSTLTDDEKEHKVRRMSLQVLGDTLRFTGKILAIVLACVILVAATQALFGVSDAGFMHLLTAWQGIVAAIVGALAYAHLRPHVAGGDRVATDDATGDSPPGHRGH